MKIILTKEQINNFPIHDASIHSFSFIQNSDGRVDVVSDIKITDDSYECGYVIPQQDGITKLFFKNCWWIKNEFNCDASNRDSFFSLVLLENSKKLSEIKSRGRESHLYHYQLKLNSGSQLDIIAEEVNLQ